MCFVSFFVVCCLVFGGLCSLFGVCCVMRVVFLVVLSSLGWCLFVVVCCASCVVC